MGWSQRFYSDRPHPFSTSWKQASFLALILPENDVPRMNRVHPSSFWYCNEGETCEVTGEAFEFLPSSQHWQVVFCGCATAWMFWLLACLLALCWNCVLSRQRCSCQQRSSFVGLRYLFIMLLKGARCLTGPARATSRLPGANESACDNCGLWTKSNQVEAPVRVAAPFKW